MENAVMKKTRVGTHWFVAAIVLFCCAHSGHAVPPDEAAIERLLQERVQSGASVGIAVGLLDETGPRVFCAGKLSHDKEKAVDANTLFNIGSVTKLFTATLLSQMVLQGDVELDDPVVRFLPDGVVIPAQNQRQITLLDLATHTSGLPRNHVEPLRVEREFSPHQMYQLLGQTNLTTPIGRSYRYSNLGYALLGHALTLHSGQPYETMVIERICRPLNMTNTRIKLSEAQKSRLATGYNRMGKPVAPLNFTQTMEATGGLRSNLNDMLQWLAANTALIQNDLVMPILETHKPRRRINRSGDFIGLAWRSRVLHDRTILEHGGGIRGFRSYIGFDKATGQGVVVLSNTDHDVYNVGHHLLDKRVPLRLQTEENTEDDAVRDRQ